VAWHGHLGTATTLDTRSGPWRGHGVAAALSGRLGPWRSCCVVWEVAASRGHDAGGWRAAAVGWGHGVERPAGARPTVAAIGQWQN
jgi:hypothetical protein